MKKMYYFLFVAFLLSAFHQQSFSQTISDSVGAGFSKSFIVYQHPDTINKERVVQQVVGGLDLNGNGKKEFLYVTDNSFIGTGEKTRVGYSLFLFENSGDNKYSKIWSYHITDTVGGSFPHFCIADLNGNGKPEIVLGVQYDANLPTVGADPNRLLIFEFGSTTLPTTPTATWNFNAPAGSNNRPSALIAGDVDGDGKQELALAFRAFTGSTKGIIIASLNGDFAGPFTQWNKEVYDTTTVTATIFGTARITDIDNDGKKEFAFGYSGSAKLVVYEADAANTYSRYEWDLNKASGAAKLSGTTLSMAQADINGDGKNELLWGDGGNGNLWVLHDVDALKAFDSTYVSSKLHRIGSFSNQPLSTITGLRGIAAGHIDGNNKTDIFVSNRGRIWRLEYKGTGLVQDSSSYTTNIVYQDTNKTQMRWISFTGDTWAKSMGITATDMDGDNKAELLLANQKNGDADSGVTKVVILESNSTTSVGIDNNGQVVGTYTLDQNYPNPFNPTTTITFALSHAGKTEMVVYDVAGRTVATLVNGFMEAGSHAITFNASKISSGTYFYQLRVNGNVVTRKMNLIK